MPDVTVSLTGTFLESDTFAGVKAEMALRVLGGPLSFRFTIRDAVSLNDVWNAITNALSELVHLPSIPDGPWSIIFDNPITDGLEPDDVARAIMFVVSEPPHVDVNELLVRPTAQDG